MLPFFHFSLHLSSSSTATGQLEDVKSSFFYLFLLVIYSLIITYGIAYDKFLLIIVYVNRFSKDPYKIVPQPHYKQKMELTWPMAARLSVSPSIPPFLIPTYGTIRDFLESTPQGFSQRRALRDFYGRNLPEKPASSLPFLQARKDPSHG